MGKGKHDLVRLTAVFETAGLKGLTKGERIALTKAGILPGIRSERERQLRARYGMTLEDYEALLEAQNGACAICEQEWHSHLYVDHSHETGEVRGLLCAKCNTLVGQLETADDIMAALVYIQTGGSCRS